MSRREVILVGCVILVLGLTGCVMEPEQAEQASVAQQQIQYSVSQPIPRFDYSLERDVVIDMYTARNGQVATHTVWRGDTSRVEGDCASIGYPIPYDTSLTNPQQALWSGGVDGRAGVTIEMAEPNGLFPSKNSTATWVRCVYEVNGKNITAPVYVEGKVTAYPFPVKVDYVTGRVQPVSGAAPSVVLGK